MESLKNWMVGLDLSEIDDSVIKFTKMLSDVLKPDRIEFMHMVPWLPDEVSTKLSNEVRMPSYDGLMQEVEDKVFKHFTGNDPIFCEVMEGSVQFDLWQESYVKQTDLFIAGSKDKHQGRGLFPKKFVRKSVCSVLFIPKELPANISNVWIPIDFSEASGQAFNQGLHMAQEFTPVPKISLQHVYEMPHAYYYEGFPKDEIMRAVRELAEQQFEEFNKKYNPYELEVASLFTPLAGSYAADHIKREAEQGQASLILAASSGRSRFSKFFLGSETERLVQQEKKIPLLILKHKKEQLKLWDLINA